MRRLGVKVVGPGMVIAGVLLAAAPTPGQSEARDTGSDQWVAVDALGRAMPGPAEVGPPKAGKAVAMFYFLWLDRDVARHNPLFDLAKILAGNPKDPAYGPPGAFHWWGEPRFGYYLNDDPWVIRKHAQLLADAGIDAIAFDVTNGPTYDDNLLAVCRVFAEVRADGGRTPQVFFLTHSHAGQVAKRVYDRFYAKNLHPDLWFRWQGKPLLLGPEAEMGPEVRAFFTIRDSWAWTDPKGWFGDGKDKWPWVDNHPQKPGWHDRRDRPEEISVAVAQHPTTNIGRSFHDGKQPPPDRCETDRGLCFAEQWRRALEVDPEVVFVTGWNEWIAQRFVAGRDGEAGFLGHPVKKGETYFVDQYSREFSRDIEPMRGGHGDDYYYQLAANIRRFKGARPLPKATAAKTIRIGRDFGPWGDVGPEYLDDLGDTAHRDHPGWGVPSYKDDSGRNDLDLAKVARDADHLYFYARTRAPLTPPGAPGWMWLLLDLDGDHRTGWEGYDILVNRKVSGGVGSVERNVGGRWSWSPIGEAPLAVSGRELHLAIPRATLGLTAAKGPLQLDFKWADNVPESGDILDFLDRGDVVPNARFNARFEE